MRCPALWCAALGLGGVQWCSPALPCYSAPCRSGRPPPAPSQTTRLHSLLVAGQTQNVPSANSVMYATLICSGLGLPCPSWYPYLISALFRSAQASRNEARSPSHLPPILCRFWYLSPMIERVQCECRHWFFAFSSCVACLRFSHLLSARMPFMWST